MTSQITIEKTDWAGKAVWIICENGKQIGLKMYSSRESAQQAALAVRS